jgi:hypothetical protein
VYLSLFLYEICDIAIPLILSLSFPIKVDNLWKRFYLQNRFQYRMNLNCTHLILPVWPFWLYWYITIY